jgi:hypothetical protein
MVLEIKIKKGLKTGLEMLQRALKYFFLEIHQNNIFIIFKFYF